MASCKQDMTVVKIRNKDRESEHEGLVWNQHRVKPPADRYYLTFFLLEASLVKDIFTELQELYDKDWCV